MNLVTKRFSGTQLCSLEQNSGILCFTGLHDYSLIMDIEGSQNIGNMFQIYATYHLRGFYLFWIDSYNSLCWVLWDTVSDVFLFNS